MDDRDDQLTILKSFYGEYHIHIEDRNQQQQGRVTLPIYMSARGKALHHYVRLTVKRRMVSISFRSGRLEILEFGVALVELYSSFEDKTTMRGRLLKWIRKI